GWVRVREEVVGYKILQRGCVLARRPLELPPLEYETEGIWLVWEEEAAGGALHGAEHALVATVPLVVGCAAADVGGVSAPVHPETGLPTLLIYDAFPGGLGISRALFARAREWVEKTVALLASCPCQEGCPRCVLSPAAEAGTSPWTK
ncbi:MAG: Zn-binding domain-containing protein, partial [Candidatus Bipolaricaulaceae bacterium]